MEVVDKYGVTQAPVNVRLLPSDFRSKIDHPAFEKWRILSKRTAESWNGMQMTFLRHADKYFKGPSEKVDKYCNTKASLNGKNYLLNGDFF